MQVAITRKEMTPNTPMYMSGHAIRTEKHKGVLDPLYCTVLLIESDETVCFVTHDVVMVDEAYTIDLRKNIAEALHIPFEHVFVSFLHNHSGPEFTELNVFTKTREFASDLEYVQWVKEMSVDLALKAKEQLQPVNASLGKVTIDGYYGNRNGIDIPCDKEITIVKFENSQQTIASFMNFPCHGTVLGSQNLLLSADLPGAIRAQLEKAYDTTMCVFIGAAGDMGNRQYRQESTPKELDRTSTGIVNQILEKMEYQPISLEGLQVYPYEYVIDYVRSMEDTKAEIMKIEQELASDIPYSRRQLLTSGLAIQKGHLLEDAHVVVSLKGAIIDTKDAMFVTIPAELFNRFGLEMKQAVDKQVFVFGYTNYSIGYMVEESEWGKNYESMASSIQKGDPEKYTKFIVERMREILG